MTHTSCIRHPENSRYIQLHDWQVEFCNRNHCAALLLAYFTAWHDWKLKHDNHYRRSNDIAEMHGDGRPYIQNAYLFFSTEELMEGCMGIYGKKSIAESLEYLQELGVIKIEKNPNPRYHFDKTKHFKFYPHVCNQWITENYPINSKEKNVEQFDPIDRPFLPDRKEKNDRRSGKNGQPTGKNGRAIPDTTYNTTNNNQSINETGFSSNEKELLSETFSQKTKPIVLSLIEEGISPKQFFEDNLKKIENLQKAGATSDQFIAAYQKAIKLKGHNVAVNYIISMVSNELINFKRSSSDTKIIKPDKSQDQLYVNDFTNGLHWMGDLVELKELEEKEGLA